MLYVFIVSLEAYNMRGRERDKRNCKRLGAHTFLEPSML